MLCMTWPFSFEDTMTIKRVNFPDSMIMEALEAEDFSIPAAAKRLGVRTATLYTWIDKSSNLKGFIRSKMDLDAIEARERIKKIMDLDYTDPKFVGHVLSACKVLLDKAESTKLQIDGTQETTHAVSEELNETLKKLLGDV